MTKEASIRRPTIQVSAYFLSSRIGRAIGSELLRIAGESARAQEAGTVSVEDVLAAATLLDRSMISQAVEMARERQAREAA